MKKWIVLACFISVPAWAQQKPSPEMEALGNKLMVEINAGIQCNANGIAGRQALEAAQKEIEGLKKELADAKQVPSIGKADGSGKSQP